MRSLCQLSITELEEGKNKKYARVNIVLLLVCFFRNHVVRRGILRDFFTSKGFKILLATIFIAAGLSIISFQYSDNAVKSVWSAICAPIQKVTTHVADFAGKLFEDSKSVDEYESEINRLKSEIEALRRQLVNYTELENENKKYAEYMQIKKSNESLKFAPASVISRDTNENFYGFMINQGSSSGISVNDPVITNAGVVGKVVSVNLFSAKVATILSPECNIGAAERTTLDSGVINGSIKLADQNLVKMLYIPAQTKMPLDGVVITTGLGGVFPRNLIVGRVKELKNDDYSSSRYAIVEPFQDIRTIRDVLVVTSFDGKGAIENGSLKELLEQSRSEFTATSSASSTMDDQRQETTSARQQTTSQSSASSSTKKKEA